MADYQFNTNLGPAQQQGTSLADLINTARGVQAYQQAEQMNPMAAQKAKMEIEQAQKINPLEVQQKEEAVKQAKTGTEKAQFGFESEKAQKSRDLIGALSTSQAFRSGNRQKMLQELADTQQELIRSGFKPHEALLAVSPILDKAMRDPQGVVPFLENAVRQSVGPESRLSLQTPQLTTVAGAPATFVPGTETAKPVNIGGAQGGQPAMQGNVMPEAGKPQGVTSTQMQLSYPVRRAGDIRPLAPNEAADTERGAKYRNDLTMRQTDLSKSRRNLDEVIEAAGKIAKEDLFSSGVLGAATRGIKGALGDEKYKQLSKDLANVQISNMQAMGGSMETDAGKQLIRMANGDETYPPDVLKKIARRTYADLTNLDMQATGASKFAQKYGDSNLNTFKQQWAKNADSKVFEAMSLFENIQDPAKRKEEIDKLLGSNPQQRQEFFQKYNNIKKLTQTGEL